MRDGLLLGRGSLTLGTPTSRGMATALSLTLLLREMLSVCFLPLTLQLTIKGCILLHLPAKRIWRIDGWPRAGNPS